MLIYFRKPNFKRHLVFTFDIHVVESIFLLFRVCLYTYIYKYPNDISWYIDNLFYLPYFYVSNIVLFFAKYPCTPVSIDEVLTFSIRMNTRTTDEVYVC